MFLLQVGGWLNLDIVLVSSSPEEVHGLARPVAEKALSMLPAADIWMFVSPREAMPVDERLKSLLPTQE